MSNSLKPWASSDTQLWVDEVHKRMTARPQLNIPELNIPGGVPVVNKDAESASPVLWSSKTSPPLELIRKRNSPKPSVPSKSKSSTVGWTWTTSSGDEWDGYDYTKISKSLRAALNQEYADARADAANTAKRNNGNVTIKSGSHASTWTDSDHKEKDLLYYARRHYGEENIHLYFK